MTRSADAAGPGLPAPDGRVGIRDVVAVVYLVECARQVAEAIAAGRETSTSSASAAATRAPTPSEMLERLCTHPNVGAVALVSLGCEGFDRERLADVVAASGRPVTTLVIQQARRHPRDGGRGAGVDRRTCAPRRRARTVPLGLSDLVVGTICGGSDGTSGITANPVVGRVFDRLVAAGGTAVFEETGELIGCEHHMAQRAVTAELGREIVARVAEGGRLLHGDGTRQLLAGQRRGWAHHAGGEVARRLLEVGQRADPRRRDTRAARPGPRAVPARRRPRGRAALGLPEHQRQRRDRRADRLRRAPGAVHHRPRLGRRSAISPVVKVCANPETYRRMSEDMDVDAGRILEGRDGIDDVADEVLDLVSPPRPGRPTASEDLGHREFVLTYKSSEPTGPACLPMASMTSRSAGLRPAQRACGPTVVHVGPGVFHRAHQAVYADARAAHRARASGAIWGVSLRSSAVRDALAPQRFRLPRRGTRRSGDAGASDLGALLGIDVAAEGVEPALARLADPAVTVVTVTVTEHGYCASAPAGRSTRAGPRCVHDLERPARAALAARAPARGPRPPARGGHRSVRGRVLRQPARQRPGHRAGRRRPRRVPGPAPGRRGSRGNVAFPSSMVDRMVPGDDRRRPGAAAGDRRRRRLAGRDRTVLAMGARGRVPGRPAGVGAGGRRDRRRRRPRTSRPSCGS